MIMIMMTSLISISARGSGLIFLPLLDLIKPPITIKQRQAGWAIIVPCHALAYIVQVEVINRSNPDLSRRMSSHEY